MNKKFIIVALVAGCSSGDRLGQNEQRIAHCIAGDDVGSGYGGDCEGPDAPIAQDAGGPPGQDAPTPVDAPSPDSPPPDGGGLPTPECFGDLLTVAEELENQLYAQVLQPCSEGAVVPVSATTPMPPPVTDPETEGDYQTGQDDNAEGGGSEDLESETPAIENCGYSESQVEAHDDAIAALTDFQSYFQSTLENTAGEIYANGTNYSTTALLSCLVLLNGGGGDNPPAPPPAPVCNPANTEYNCKALVYGGTQSLYSASSYYPFVQDTARGTTCTDTLWRPGFYWERLLYAPWSTRSAERRAQIMVRSWAAYREGLASWETHTSCLRETESVRTKYRLVLEPKATIVPRWVWDPRANNGNGAWRENHENWGYFWNAQGQACPADCLGPGEQSREFKVGASVRPKLTAQFGGYVQSEQKPDGYWDWGNNTYDYRAQVSGTLHCFGPGTLYTAADTFTTVPSDVPMPFDALIAPDCTVTDNASVNGSISYQQQGQQGTFTLGLSGGASQQTVCRKDATDARLNIACNMAEGAGFANFRTAAIEMPAHGTACVNNKQCAWYGMMVGNGAQAANKLDLGYWFEQLAAIARAAPADGRNWAHSRRGYAFLRRGSWQYDVNNPDWPGSWSGHRHAWEGSACRLYKVINATTPPEAMAEDKAICAFSGQRLTDPSSAPGLPTANPASMLWPFDNLRADWDPEHLRPKAADCTQNAQCTSGSCVAGVCQ